MLEDVFRTLGFVLECDAHAFVDVADDFETLLDQRGIKLDFGKNRGIGWK
jgi:hypothetical protein